MKTIIKIIVFLVFVTNLKSDWIPISNGIPQLNIYSIATTNGYLFAGTNVNFQGGGIFASTNYGAGWYQVNENTTLALGSFGNTVYAGYQFGLRYSSNFGETWSSAGLNRWIQKIITYEDKIYACCRDYGLYVSTNNGINWTQTSLNDKSVHDLTINGTDMYAGLDVYGVYHSSNSGIDWVPTSLNFTTVWSIANKGNIIFAGSGGSGVYISTNNGINWIQSTLNNATPHSILVYNGNIYEGGGGTSSINVSTNDGITWIPKMDGMPYYVRTILVLNNYIYAGTDGAGVFKRPLSELTDLNVINQQVPIKCTLMQNYPNPFNPSTSIKFSIPKRSFVQVQIYDILGRIKELLVQEFMNPAEYELTIDGSQYSSGVYFYQLIADGKIMDTKKFMVIK